MELITLNNVVLLSVVIGLTQLIKKYVSARYVQLLPVVLGVIGALAISGFSVAATITGIVIGLSAAGLYDQKKIAQ